MLIEDFEKNQKVFRSDTFNLSNQSTDEGRLIAYHAKGKDLLLRRDTHLGDSDGTIS